MCFRRLRAFLFKTRRSDSFQYKLWETHCYKIALGWLSCLRYLARITRPPQRCVMLRSTLVFFFSFYSLGNLVILILSQHIWALNNTTMDDCNQKNITFGCTVCRHIWTPCFDHSGTHGGRGRGEDICCNRRSVLLESDNGRSTWVAGVVVEQE